MINIGVFEVSIYVLLLTKIFLISTASFLKTFHSNYYINKLMSLHLPVCTLAIRCD